MIPDFDVVARADEDAADGPDLITSLRAINAQQEADIYELRRALFALLNCMERGDGHKIQERMRAAGQLLGLTRYDGNSPGSMGG